MTVETNVNFDFAVVGGAGLIGSAATKYLSAAGYRVAGIGSPEPADYRTHADVFASHYDDARVARILDANPMWARLAAASMQRYASIQSQSGIAFHQPVGCLRIGTPDVIDRLIEGASGLGAEFARLDNAALVAQYPYLRPHDMVGVIERGLAGTLAPRALVRAQHAIARQHGVTLIADVVLRVEQAAGGCILHLKSGGRLSTGRVLVAAGAFTNFHALLPVRIPFKAMPETVVLMRVPDSMLCRSLPALLYYRHLNEVAKYIYATPPMQYEDGVYMKVGAANDGYEVTNLAQAVDYFRSGGSTTIAARLAAGACDAMPEMQRAGYKVKPCILANTDTGLPYISAVTPGRVYVAAGGCGAAAKSSDEIGRLAAALMLDQEDCSEFALSRSRSIT